MLEGGLNWKSATHFKCHLKIRIVSHYLWEYIGVLWERLAGITKFGHLNELMTIKKKKKILTCKNSKLL